MGGWKWLCFNIPQDLLEYNAEGMHANSKEKQPMMQLQQKDVVQGAKTSCYDLHNQHYNLLIYIVIWFKHIYNIHEHTYFSLKYLEWN